MIEHLSWLIGTLCCDQFTQFTHQCFPLSVAPIADVEHSADGQIDQQVLLHSGVLIAEKFILRDVRNKVKRDMHNIIKMIFLLCWVDIGWLLRLFLWNEILVAVANQSVFNFNDLLQVDWHMEMDEGRIGPCGELLCLWQTPTNSASHAWQHFILIWLLGQSICSSPSTEELHDRLQWSIFFIMQGNWCIIWSKPILCSLSKVVKVKGKYCCY